MRFGMNNLRQTRTNSCDITSTPPPAPQPDETLIFEHKYLPKNIFADSKRTAQIDDVFANKNITSFTLLIRLEIKVWARKARRAVNRQTTRQTRRCKFPAFAKKCEEEPSKNNVKEPANCRCACKYNNFKWLAMSCAILMKGRIFALAAWRWITIFINIMVRSLSRVECRKEKKVQSRRLFFKPKEYESREITNLTFFRYLQLRGFLKTRNISVIIIVTHSFDFWDDWLVAHDADNQSRLCIVP